MSDNDIYPFTTFTNVAKVLKEGNATNCVWCKKAMLASEVDSFGRCGFDSEFPFDTEGQAQALQARGEIAIIMIHKGILP
jgi:hypothetical protein